MRHIAITKNRMSIIEKYAKGKDVLDLGCVDARPDGSKKYHSSGLHIFLRQQAKSLLGLDIDDEGVKMLRLEGYDVVAGNAENVSLDKQFDCIVAGEIIEHLSNFGNFLDNMHRHLKDDGYFVLTTSNAFSILSFYRILVKNEIKVHGEHTCWFDPLTLSQLLSRHGFDVVEIAFSNKQKWYDPKYFYKIKSQIFRLISSLRSYFSGTVIVVARKTQGYAGEQAAG